MNGQRPLLVCYDGSEGARAALDVTVQLFPGHEAIVACYWQPFAKSGKRFGMHILELVQNAASINEQEEQLARQVAEDGAALVRAGGLSVEGRAVQIDASVDEAIIAHAEEIDALTIVLGSRSRERIRSLLLGDIANEVVQRATRPVLVAPSTRLADRRRDEFARYPPAEQDAHVTT